MASSSSTSSSRSKVQEQQQDRFDALPDPILLHILYFLPTLDAVRTSVLSTRWRTLWTSVGALDFDEENDFFSGAGKRIVGSTKRKRKSKSKRRFKEFVGKVLSFHHTPTLHKLRLSCFSQNCPLKDWVRMAVFRGVQMLDLRLLWHSDPDEKAGQLPSLLFASQSLVDLRLDLKGSKLILPGTLALVGLQRMHLRRVKFCDDATTRALFSNSTAMRSLALEKCDYQNLGCLEIACSSLQELAIEGNSLGEDGDLGSCQVKIAASQLSCFVYCASVAQAYVVDPLFCVKYVKIQFEHCKARNGLVDKPSILDRASSFLCSLSSARNLDICPACVEALTRFRRKTSLYPFCKLNVLRVKVEHPDYGALRVVLKLLLSNPHLRSLLVEVKNMYVLPSSAGKEDFLKLLRACFESRNGVLERVEIRCNPFTCSRRVMIRYTTETVLELVKALLGSQARLNKLILSNRLFSDSFYPDRRWDAVMEKVLSFPKRSSELLAVAFI